MSENESLTIQEGADFLNVSLEFMVQLVEDGEIRVVKVDQRINLADLLKYRAQRDLVRRDALQNLTNLSQESGGYSELEE